MYANRKRRAVPFRFGFWRWRFVVGGVSGEMDADRHAVVVDCVGGLRIMLDQGVNSDAYYSVQKSETSFRDPANDLPYSQSNNSTVKRERSPMDTLSIGERFVF